MLPPLIGEHPTLRRVRLQLPILAKSHEPLVIVGEPGVGKSLVAAHLHARSSFARCNIITIDCSLLDHRAQRLRLFGGSIGESSSVLRSPFESETTVVIKHPECLFTELQVRITRAFTTQNISRFNSSALHALQCRIVFILGHAPDSPRLAARLSPELLHLLVHLRRIAIPPLRKRKNDIALLIKHFTRRQVGNSFVGVLKSGRPSATLIRLLNSCKWEGNVAELRAFIDALAIRSPAAVLASDDIVELFKVKRMIEDQESFSLRNELRVIRDSLVNQSLLKVRGNRVRASQLLGLTEAALR